MPKRSTTFQKLIELLETQLAPEGSRITPSKLLKDIRTDEEREVDIVIETKSGLHPITIGIEVIEHKRKATTPWIEKIAKKHEDLPIDKSIAVSKTGFYKPALIKAKAYKIDTLTLEDAKNIDWQSTLKDLQTITIGSFLIPQLTHANIIFEKNSSLVKFSDVEISKLNLYDNSDSLIGVLERYLDSYLKSPEFISFVEEKAFIEDDTVIDGRLHLPKGSYVQDNNGNKHNVTEINFRARCRKQEMQAELLKGKYRDRSVALASGDSFGKPIHIAISEKKDDEPKFTFRIMDNE